MSPVTRHQGRRAPCKPVGAAGPSTTQAGSKLSQIAKLIDLDGNGNPLDDILRAVQKAVH